MAKGLNLNFQERVYFFRNDEGQEMQGRWSKDRIIFETGGKSQVGRIQNNDIILASSRGEIWMKARSAGIDFPPSNSVMTGHWTRVNLCLEFAEECFAIGSQQRKVAQETWMQDTDEAQIRRISQCQIRITGAMMDGTPPLEAITFEDVFRHLEAEIPEKLRQNLVLCGTWRRPPTLFEKYVLTAGLSERDVLCIAPVKSGQTRAFLMPMLHAMMSSLKSSRADIVPKGSCRYPDTLILTPTEESASECHRIAGALLHGSHIRCVGLCGQSIAENLQDLAHGVDLLVATPATLTPMVINGIVSLKQVFGFVMVDASCMVDTGMRKFYESLLDCGMPPSTKRLSMMLMTSMVNPEVLALSKEVLHKPVIVHAMPCDRTSPQIFCVENDDAKLACLENHFRRWQDAGQTARILVWVHSRMKAQFLAERFYWQRVPCAALCQSMEPWERHYVWRKFCNGSIKVIFTTDAGSNGLDIGAVDLLLHYDLPSTPNLLSLRLNRERIWYATVYMYVNPNSDHSEVLSALASTLAENGTAVPDWLANARPVRPENEHSESANSTWERWDHYEETGIVNGRDRGSQNGQWQGQPWQPWERNDDWSSQWQQNGTSWYSDTNRMNQWGDNQWNWGQDRTWQ